MNKAKQFVITCYIWMANFKFELHITIKETEYFIENVEKDFFTNQCILSIEIGITTL